MVSRTISGGIWPSFSFTHLKVVGVLIREGAFIRINTVSWQRLEQNYEMSS